ncbi:hypothetical protein Tco_1378379 [Tanacetum coccineum]
MATNLNWMQTEWKTRRTKLTYKDKIGSLMHLTSSRPDIVQAVFYCARYQARPTEKYLKEMPTMLDVLNAKSTSVRKTIEFLGDKISDLLSKK